MATAALHVVLLLTVGFLVYLLWRPTTLRMFVWFEVLGTAPWVHALRDSVGSFPAWLPSSLLYSVPAACWGYALSVAIALIWRTAPAYQQRAAWAVVFTIVIAGEVMQVVPQIPGVFDPADCALDALAAAAGIAIVSRHREAACS